uniref:Calcium-activated potassium channel subunit beta-1 n=1 Tax=Geotrypetes seraphini TaxID=260995 RepID=A0A6P8Q7Q3_GEOSA|nr:calcium-activated potassium channel subunit beta-1 [Geotrypetes seraphini]XP_033783019.1 calcium-activated potassium channel subunit beta-1 [Geotrypetes seraphini]XP_033783020.1 calcium-activated potassium channel subunit beta-1 [Geotrypetes seraphini]XP_033783021.1 calcium-activated potassium channel subunit beta-1 [Geotrypetes seraphini]
MVKKSVLALKPGEIRALYLGSGMIISSVIIYFLLGVTIVPLHMKSVWTQKETCRLIQASITGVVECFHSPAASSCKASQYPCLQVTVNVNHSTEILMLYHMEDTLDINPKCSYVPNCLENSTETKIEVEKIEGNFKRAQTFPCHYDPKGEQKTVILYRRYEPSCIMFYLFWPTFMLTGGVSILILLKINQGFSRLAAQNTKINL